MKMGQLSFQQRCVSALTHPLTIGALAVLLLNDLLLKSLWPNPWTTGKLSDLAWVVFAPPLLAFLLSPLTRSRPLAERMAFSVAYLGLPLLYAAFNTFGWLHEWILSVLLPLTGGAAGSPLDPTDSIVIPFALAIALWIWKQGDVVLQRHRMRLSLFAAVAASLATVATSASEPSPSMWQVGIGSEGTVIMEGPISEHYASEDGGLTWAAVSLPTDDDIEWGGQQAGTPRGTYIIQEPGITLLGADRESTEVYSTAHLRKGVNQWVQKYETRKLRSDASDLYEDPQELVTTRPINLVYDSRTDKIVVSMGLQGVLVGDATEKWIRVGVGEFVPTDFSFSGKARLLFSLYFWFGALSFSILFAVSAVALSEGYSPPLSQWRAGLVRPVRRIAGILLVILAVAIVSYPVLLFNIGFVWVWPLSVALVPLVLMGFTLTMPRGGLFRKIVAILYAVLGIVFSSLSFPPFAGDIGSLGIIVDSLFAQSGLILSVIALVLFLPRRTQLPAFALALASMIASITLLGLLWLTGGLALLLASFAGVALLALIAVLLLRHLRNANHSQARQTDERTQPT